MFVFDYKAMRQSDRLRGKMSIVIYESRCERAADKIQDK
jgi:hypothetical protein